MLTNEMVTPFTVFPRYMVGRYSGGIIRESIEAFPKEEAGVKKFAHLPKEESGKSSRFR